MADSLFRSMSFPDEEKSWHLLAILLKIGHPVCPEHLASQCRLFTASADFIRYLTSVPGSPLFLMENGLVSASMAAAFAVGRFISVAMNRGFVSRFRFWASGPSGSRDAVDANRYLKKRKGAVLDVVELSTAKRRLYFPSTQGEIDLNRLPITNGVQEISFESCADSSRVMMRRDFPTINFESQNVDSGNAMIPLHHDTNGEGLDCPAPNFEHREADNDARESMVQGEISGSAFKASDSLFITGNDSNYQKSVDIERFMEGNLYVDLNLPISFQHPSLCNEALVGSNGFRKKVDYFDTFSHEHPEQNNIHPVDNGICESNACKDPIREPNESMQVESVSKKGLIGSGVEREMENVAQMVNPALCGEELTNGLEPKNSLNLEKDETVRDIVTQATCQKTKSSSTTKQLLQSSCMLKEGQKNDLHPKAQILKESLACNRFDNAAKNVGQYKNDQKVITRHKLKQSRKENMVDNTSITPKVEKKVYPSFEAFSVEEEEGSGGYGTVYRARRKNDGKRVAIKCPHHTAHKNHVNNERNMLERFGGKNFIIKFEGSLKSGSSDCFVLEHVEHDRPEVLKKEIDIFQLQWYGYCMFRALACLHKEGVVHRDVKPGNFLFSRKLNKGYLIDFNLAMDLKQKYNTGSKSRPSLDASSSIPLASGSAQFVKDKHLGGSKSLASNKRELVDSKKNADLSRHVKQKTCAGPQKNCPDRAGGNLFRAQGTDGSGITSAKDITSTRTPSAERPREPLPFRGRKELISLVQNSMQCPNSNSIKGPTSQRKRVIAPSGKVDGKIVYLTPMPLHSSTVAAGLLRSKGDGKHKREGPCAGTKGFRAPEVLFKSQFQGPKIDIWSAGVTLLYLVIGRTPFTADHPEQNIKEIAKLRGSEELWEVAKLHDRESSFPVELLDERYLQSWDLESWCKIHTKRPEFLQHIPKSLFDLIDKCLTVNPRNRISVEEILRHEFFASCHEILRKQRLIRRGLSSDTGFQNIKGCQFK